MGRLCHCCQRLGAAARWLLLMQLVLGVACKATEVPRSSAVAVSPNVSPPSSGLSVTPVATKAKDLSGEREARALVGPTSMPPLVPEGESELILGVVWENGVPKFSNAPPKRHRGLALAWSPDSRLLASNSNLGLVRIWDATTGKQVRRWQDVQSRDSSTTNTPGSIAWSSSGVLFAVGTSSHLHWDTATGRELPPLQAKGFTSVSWSPDGRTLASVNDHVVRLWEAATGRELRRLDSQPPSIGSIALSPTGTLLASWGHPGSGTWVWLTDAGTGQVLQQLVHSAPVESVAWSPDGKVVAVVCREFSLRLWDAATGKVLRRLEHSSQVDAVAWSPDGRTLASVAVDTSLRLWDVTTGKERHLSEHTCSASSLAWSPDGTRIALSCIDGETRLLDAILGVELSHLVGYSHGIRAVAFSPDSTRLASADDESIVHFWDLGAGVEVLRFEAHPGYIKSIAWSPNGEVLISAGSDRILRLWSVTTGKELRQLEGHTGFVNSVAWSPDGRCLAAGDGKGVRLWDAATGKALRQFEGHSELVTSVAWSADGTMLASGSFDKTVRFWDPNNGKELQRLSARQHVSSVAWRFDGKSIAVGSGRDMGELQVWESANGNWQQRGDLWGLGPGGAVAWAPDGKTFVSGKEVQSLVDSATGERVAWFKGHLDEVVANAWSPNGRAFASGGKDGTIRLWRVDDQRVEPTAVYWAGTDGWISWRANVPKERRVVRSETGDLIHEANLAGMLSSVAPLNGRGPSLSATAFCARPQTPSAMGQVIISVSNAKDASEAIWVELNVGSGPEVAAERKIVVKFPPIHVRLDPGESVDLPVGYALHGSGNASGTLKSVLELHHAHDNGQGIAVPVELQFSGS